MSDVRQAVRLLNRCRFYELEGLDFVEQFSIEQLAKDFNGLGPESFPEPLRDALNRLDPDLLPDAFIHDIRFSHGTGTEEDFKDANDQFRRNGKKLAYAKYCWIDPRRYFLAFRASRYASLCQRYGWSAYLRACSAGQSPGVPIAP